ncbi:hypothetical protein FHS34_007670 [Streptomyces echinatus]|uniref:Uncharacterized protein n=1 Tax=Streptomyces echinatus TaxID=67293 RepID=A0A7W9UVD7_9ACTN|nr:hypothetical protein [Streptomyces echinatus]
MPLRLPPRPGRPTGTGARSCIAGHSLQPGPPQSASSAWLGVGWRTDLRVLRYGAGWSGGVIFAERCSGSVIVGIGGVAASCLRVTAGMTSALPSAVTARWQPRTARQPTPGRHPHRDHQRDPRPGFGFTAAPRWLCPVCRLPVGRRPWDGPSFAGRLWGSAGVGRLVRGLVPTARPCAGARVRTRSRPSPRYAGAGARG